MYAVIGPWVKVSYVNVEPTARNFQLILSLDSDLNTSFKKVNDIIFDRICMFAVCCVLLRMSSVLSVLLLLLLFAHLFFLCFSQIHF